MNTRYVFSAVPFLALAMLLSSCGPVAPQPSEEGQLPVELPAAAQPAKEQPPVKQPPAEQLPVELPVIEQPAKEQPPVQQPPEEQIIGGQKDAHGCLVAAGYSWCEAKQKCLRIWEEPCVSEPETDTAPPEEPSPSAPANDQLLSLFEALNGTEAPTLDYRGGAALTWNMKGENGLAKVLLLGDRYGAKGLSLDDVGMLETALQIMTTTDPVNVAYSATSGLRGYTWEDVVCTLNFEGSRTTSFEAYVTCAVWSPLDREFMADKEALEQAFRDKYKKDKGAVVVSFEQVDGNYARGSVRFAPFGAPGESGIFGAYRENGTWKLAFDGNGGFSCASLRERGFPAALQEGCY